MKKNKNKSKLNFYYDDKGRKKYDVSSLYKPPIPEPKIKIEVKELTFLKPHEDKIYLDEIKGTKIEKINDKIKNVFYCKICECSFTDNSSYMEHINGKKHNKVLGMNMRVEKIDLNKVRDKLLNLKRKASNS